MFNAVFIGTAAAVLFDLRKRRGSPRRHPSTPLRAGYGLGEIFLDCHPEAASVAEGPASARRDLGHLDRAAGTSSNVEVFLITNKTSSTWRGVSHEQWARIGVVVQLVVLIRTIAEFYRLRHYYGAAEALARYEPYIGGLLIDAVLCLIAVALLFWKKPRASAITAAATILILLAYKLLVIG